MVELSICIVNDAITKGWQVLRLLAAGRVPAPRGPGYYHCR
jgi:hypothetical protein